MGANNTRHYKYRPKPGAGIELTKTNKLCMRCCRLHYKQLDKPEAGTFCLTCWPNEKQRIILSGVHT